MKDYAGVSQVLKLFVKAQLSDYSQVPSKSTYFEVEIVYDFVFIPPPAITETQPQPAPPVVAAPPLVVIETTEPPVQPPIVKTKTDESDSFVNKYQTKYPIPIPSITRVS